MQVLFDPAKEVPPEEHDRRCKYLTTVASTAGVESRKYFGPYLDFGAWRSAEARSHKKLDALVSKLASRHMTRPD
jgi:hypothetical protein